jgi:tellurite methyltransferase
MVDPTKGWDHLWKQQDVIKSGWDRPSPVVVELAERLFAAGARQVLDLGCGPGRHTVALARAGYRVSATDVSPTGLAHCRDWLSSLGLGATLAEADMRSLPFDDAAFDLVVSYNVIYHATKSGMQATLDEIGRVLRPGGHLFITFIATADAKYHQYRAKVASGEGVEVEPNTYRVPNDPDEDGDLPHHFVDEIEARELLSGYDVLTLEAERFDRREPNGQTVTKVHWHAVCQKPVTPIRI